MALQHHNKLHTYYASAYKLALGFERFGTTGYFIKVLKLFRLQTEMLALLVELMIDIKNLYPNRAAHHLIFPK